MSDSAQFGQLAAPRPEYASTEETPLKIAVFGDFSGRAEREPARSSEELRGLRPWKATFDGLDELIEELSPKLTLRTSGGEEVELEFRELDEFHPDPIYKAADVFNRLEDSREDRVNSPAARQMRELLRLPAYQALESAWRGLALLLRRTAKDRRVQVVLYDVTSAELRADVSAAEDLGQTALFDWLVTKSAAAPDGVPWGMVLGLYDFSLSEEDADLLGRLAKIATHAGGLFLTAMVSDVARRENFELAPELESAWEALRALPEASYLALATPGFLLRPPFGDNFRPPDSIPFEEFDGRPEGYLWGNSAIAAATLMALNFMEKGWGMNPAEKRVLDGMPTHAYRDENDEDVGVVTEVRFTSSVGTELAKLGLIPVLSFKGRDLIELAAIRSLSADQPLLGGLWTGGGKVTFAAPTQAATDSVNLQGGPAPESTTVKSDDPEVDDDLAALLAGGGDDDSDSESEDDDDDDSSSSDDDDEMPSFDEDDDDSKSDSDDDAGDDDDDDLDLDALMAGLGDDDEDSPAPSNDDDNEPKAAEESEEEEDDDLDLDALLAGLDDDDEEAPAEPEEDEEPAPDAEEEAPAANDEEDADLAALLAGDDGDDDSASNDDEDSSPSGSGDDDLDALLAGLGGDDDDSDNDSDDEPAEEDDEDGDLDLSDLGLDDDEEEASSEATEEEDDDDDLDLDALLAGLGGDDDEEAASEPESEPAEDDEEAQAEEAEDEEELDLDAMLAGLDDEDESPAEVSAVEEVETNETAVPVERDTPMATVDLQAEFQATQEATKYGASAVGSPPTIDFLALIQPISEDEPAGGSVPFDVRQRLDEMRREVNPADFADDDPLRPEEPIRADWQGVIRLCEQTLKEKSKNLLIAARLTEALARLHGFAGLRDGLHLFRQLVNNCWDRLDPALDEDDDLEVRAAPFNWLDDPDRGAVFPNTVRGLPIVIAGSDRFGAVHWQLARENKQGLSNDMIEQAVFNAAAEQCRRTADDAQQAVTELRQLANDLRMKMGGEAPGLSFLRPAIEEGATLAKQVVNRKGAGDAPAEAAEAEEVVAAEGQTTTVVVRQAPRAVTREDLYKQLNDAAIALQRMEPHSPVPYIIQRAVMFGSLPFPQLMMELIRNPDVLGEMNRELGIKPPPTEY